jgi:hypothetical protein
MCLTRDKRLLDDYHGGDVGAELLGVPDTTALRQLADKLTAGNDARAQVITFELVLGALESRSTKESWRSGGIGGVSYYVRAGWVPEISCHAGVYVYSALAGVPGEPGAAACRAGEPVGTPSRSLLTGASNHSAYWRACCGRA